MRREDGPQLEEDGAVGLETVGAQSPGQSLPGVGSPAGQLLPGGPQAHLWHWGESLLSQTCLGQAQSVLEVMTQLLTRSLLSTLWLRIKTHSSVSLIGSKTLSWEKQKQEVVLIIFL